MSEFLRALEPVKEILGVLGVAWLLMLGYLIRELLYTSRYTGGPRAFEAYLKEEELPPELPPVPAFDWPAECPWRSEAHTK